MTKIKMAFILAASLTATGCTTVKIKNAFNESSVSYGDAKFSPFSKYGAKGLKVKIKF